MEPPRALGPSPSSPTLESAAPAVEVAARRGDSIVGVDYLVAHDERRHHAGTRVLAVAGAALLLSAAFAFAHGVSIANGNAAARNAWLESGRPLLDFRPARVSTAFDLLGALGLGGGVALFGWALVRRLAGDSRRQRYRIGSAPDIEFCLDDAPQPAFPLVERDGDQFLLRLGGDMRAELTAGGATTEFVGERTLALPAGVRARVTCGPVEFLVRPVLAPRVIETGWAGLESRPLLYGAGSALAHASILALAWATPPDLATATLGFASDDAGLLSIDVAAADDALRERTEGDNADDGTSAGEGAAEAGDAGAIGTAVPERPEGRRAIARRNDQPAWARRDEAVFRARAAGVLGAFSAADFHARIAGIGDMSSGFDRDDTLGGYDGALPGDALGGWGTATRGTGPAGGGRTIGIGPLGTASFTGGCGSDTRCGKGPTMKKPERGGPRFKPGPVQIQGEYDSAVIRRAVRQRRAALRHCYERQLQVQPTLSGTVTATFLIDGSSGAVLSATARGMGSQPVERCVASTLETVRLPRLDAGGMHRVTYPFTFHAN